ncbi:hypothetical protein KKE14_01125 [Patescibacteria group bacterium]|nr:hypothetical protein [Patescibacteria group bacterium]
MISANEWHLMFRNGFLCALGYHFIYFFMINPVRCYLIRSGRFHLEKKQLFGGMQVFVSSMVIVLICIALQSLPALISEPFNAPRELIAQEGNKVTLKNARGIIRDYYLVEPAKITTDVSKPNGAIYYSPLAGFTYNRNLGVVSVIAVDELGNIFLSEAMNGKRYIILPEGYQGETKHAMDAFEEIGFRGQQYWEWRPGGDVREGKLITYKPNDPPIWRNKNI